MYLPSDKKKLGEKQLKNRSKTIGKVREIVMKSIPQFNFYKSLIVCNSVLLFTGCIK